jgi:hypothetical protein
VYVVAIAELKRSIEDEAPDLAEDLGATAYDARLLLASGAPIVAKTTPDREAALELLARLRARGHGAVACDTSAVVSSGDMVAMRRPVFGDDAVALAGSGAEPGTRATGVTGAEVERLPYDDVLALVPAVHRRRVDTTTQVRETQLSVGRAVASGGVMFTKSVKKDTHATSEERGGVLYVFRRSGATPWLLREHGTSWIGTGLPLAPSESENFRAAVGELRRRAPGAVYDERLVARKVTEKMALSGAGGTTTVKTSTDAAVDLLAHVVAMWAAKGNAYR